MRRVLQLSRLSGLLVTGFLSTHAFAQEPTDAEQPTEEQKAEQPAPVAPAATVAPDATVVAPAPVIAPAARPKVGDMSAHGYFRGGFGANLNKKGRMTCFALPNPKGLLSKYRLGNECEVWAELELTTVAYVGEDGSVASLHFMPVAFIPTTYIGYSPTGVTSSDLGSTGTGATVAFPNLYVDIKGISWLFGGTAWSGTRYYKRESIYISDFFYWNPSGVGAGIEDINLGKIWDSAPDVVRDLTFSYGVFAVDGEPNGNQGPQLPMITDLGIRNDFQVRGIRPYEGGELQIGFQYIKNWTNKNVDPPNGNKNTTDGWGVTVRHVQNVLGGDNKLVFQYGKGGGTGFGTLSRFYYPDFSIYHDPAESRLRVLDVITIQPTDWFGMQANVVYQRDNTGTGNSDAVTQWYSAGGRLSLGVANHLKLLSEYGYDHAKKSNGAAPQTLQKLTGAIALAGANGFFGRPELRLFYTWAWWNDAVRGLPKHDSGDVYLGTNDLSGSLLGLQAEAMW
ncbi:MAG TPA: carbohydrate porin [Polyangia bacterium]